MLADAAPLSRTGPGPGTRGVRRHSGGREAKPEAEWRWIVERMWKNVARHGTEEKILMEDRHGREKNVSVNTDDLRVQADKRVTTIATIMQPPAPREKWFGTLFSVEAKLQVVTHRPIDLLGTCVTQYSCRVLQSQGAGPPGESGSLLLCRAPPPIPESGHWVLFPLTCRGEEIPPLNLAPPERASVCGMVRLGRSACPVQEACLESL